MNKEHKYKDKDEYKDNDKDKDAERITESLTVCYIYGIKHSKNDGGYLPMVNLLSPLSPLSPPAPARSQTHNTQKISSANYLKLRSKTFSPKQSLPLEMI